MLRVRDDAARKHGDLLYFGRDDTDDVDAMHGTQLAQLLEADLGVTARDHLANRRRGDHLALRPHGVGDAELREHLVLDVDAASAVRVRDRSRVQQRLPEAINRADVGLRRSGANGHRDRRTREVDTAIRGDRPGLDQPVERVADHDDDVGLLAARQAIRDRLGVVPIDGPETISSAFPVCCLYAGASSRSAAENPPEIITRTVSASAIARRTRIIAAAAARNTDRELLARIFIRENSEAVGPSTSVTPADCRS